MGPVPSPPGMVLLPSAHRMSRSQLGSASGHVSDSRFAPRRASIS
jgi:hypothetical protein